jgi:hypothetical protein
VKINTQTGTLTVIIDTISIPPFEYLHIAYIVFLANSPIIFSEFDPSIGSFAPYQFIGLNSINDNKFTYYGNAFQGMGLIECNGNLCSEGCISI